MKPDFPLVWDNSMRSALVDCPQAFWWSYGYGYRSLAPSVHLHAGKAWASALETLRLSYYTLGFTPDDALQAAMETLIKEYGTFECPPYESKTLPRMLEALAYYTTAFPLATDPVQPYEGKNGAMIEFDFALPLDIDRVRHPVTDEPIIYSGRTDMIATYAGALSIYDDKTTKALGATWGKQWQRRSQFSGYSWAAHEMGIRAQQIIVRGIAIKKTEIDHAQVILNRLDYQRAEWHEQCVRDILRAIAMWKENRWDKNLGDTCSAYSGCMFLTPCGAKDPEPWLKSNYQIKLWNPITREETFGENDA
jgi:hypothetical protein